MNLTPHDRKLKLGHGGLSKVARLTKRTAGHVTEVNSERRRDEVVERAISREIARLNPDIDVATIWPVEYSAGAQETPQRGGDDVADVREHDRTISAQEHDHVPTAIASGGTGANRTRAVR